MTQDKLEQLKRDGQWLQIVHLLQTDEANYNRSANFSELGFAYSQLGQFDKARECYDRWIAADRRSARAYYCRGYIDYLDNRDTEAVVFFRQALACYGDYLVCLYRMGVTLLRLRRRDEARDALKKAITIYQHSTDEDFRRRNGKNYYKAIYQLGKVYLAKKRYGHAEACFSKVLNEDCRSYNQKGFVRFRLAKCFYLQADYQRALDQLADIDDNVAHKEFTHDLRGRCHFKLGDAAAAIKAFDQALKRKADGYIFRNRALAHILAKNLEAAKRDLDVAMRKDRLGKHKTLLILGEVAMLQNHLSEAIAYFEKAIAYKYKKYDAIYREAHMALGEAYEMQGNRDKAAVHFGQAAELINRPDHIREAVPGHD